MQPRWVSFPASPRFIRSIEVDLVILSQAPPSGLFWGCGGPGFIFSPLFQLLNRFVHYGYQFFPIEKAPKDVHLENLVINIEFTESIPSTYELSDESIAEKRLQAFRHTATELSMLARQGLLTGKISQIGVRYSGLEEIIDTNEFKASEKVSKEWVQYGFHWGDDERLDEGERAAEKLSNHVENWTFS
ncbi:MAG: hypothetical protein Q9219_007644 [cf. Caloplaca sp. 3 TL-2023]